MSTSWFNIVPFAHQGDSSPPAGLIAVGVTTNGSEYNTLQNSFLNNKAFSYKGKSYGTWNGPFPDLATAKSSVGGASGWTEAGIIAAGVIGTLGNTSNPALGAGATAGNAAGTAAGALASIGNTITGFIGGLTSANLWIRIAKVTAGGIIMIVGLAKLTGFSHSGIVNSAVKAAPLL